MKKLFLLLSVLFFYIPVYAQYEEEQQFNGQYNFEIGPKLGYVSYDDDILESGFSYGLQGMYNFDSDMRLKVSYSRYKSDSYDEVNELVYSESWTSTSESEEIIDESFVIDVYYTNIYTNYYFVNWIMSYDVKTSPLFFEYDYLFNFTDFVISVGAGIGVSMNDISVSSSFQGRTAESMSIADDLNSRINVSADINDNFIYGLTAGFIYNGYFENLTFSADLSYIRGEADGDVTINAPGQTTERRKFDFDTNNISLFLSANYCFG